MYFHTIDTETDLIAPGKQAPRLVLFQFKGEEPEGAPSLLHGNFNRKEILSWLSIVLSGPRGLRGQRIAFDMAVICANFPELIPAVFDAYEQGRVSCTIVRQKLLDIADGREWRDYTLEALTKRFSLPVKEGDNPWRFRFGELWNTPVEAMPREAIDYARDDVVAAQSLHRVQTELAGRFPYGDVFADESRQCAADFWLTLVAAWGVNVDGSQVDKYYQVKRDQIEGLRAELCAAGLVRANGTRDIKRAAALMVDACERAGIKVPETDGGGVSLSADSIGLTGDELLSKYAEFLSADMVLARIERLRKAAQAKAPIQPRFDSLKATGRTSCSQGDDKGKKKTGLPPSAFGFQLQNPPREPGIRECFIPRDGNWFVSADWTGVELRAWSSACLWLTGASRMASVLLDGRDPHNELGGRVAGQSPEWADAVMRGDFGTAALEKFKADERQIAKIGNFGFQGGMGAETLVVQARAEYGVILTLEKSLELRMNWRETWPEHRPYFEVVNRCVEAGYLLQLKSQRFRGGIGFCQAANSFFQGLSADVAKEAGFRILRECYAVPSSPLYGSRVWNFAHDEFLIECLGNPYVATQVGERVQTIMVDTANRWMPELTGAHAVEVSVMERWAKKAKHRRAKSGRFQGCLIPYNWQTDEG